LSEKDMNADEPVTEVYKAVGEMEALVVKGLLESYGIPCYLKSHAAPSVHVLTVDGMAEFRVMVPNSEVERAKELVRGRDESCST